MVKVIRTRAEYDSVLTAIEELMDREPAAGTRDADRLELLSVLVQDYEDKVSPRTLPSPLDAIRFRMEQKELTQRDLVPYIGSKSKVSEVLSGKRPLTLPMIRALHAGLGIPAKVLLQELQGPDLEQSEIAWDRYPIAEMVKRNWIAGVHDVAEARANAEKLVKEFFRPIGSLGTVAVLLKKTRHVRGSRSMNKHALEAWIARVMIRATEDLPSAGYAPGTVTADFMSEVVRLSWFNEGPRLACEFLARHGVPVIIEPHLAGTYLDGAAVLLDSGRPVIGMTIRHDRLDNFWFCLLHELAHIRLHFGGDAPQQFIDDVEVQPVGDRFEEEADQAASEALIPEKVWRASPASKGRASIAIRMLADELKIHPAIVAGKIRRQYNDYRVLNDLVGRGDVRKLFPSADWKIVEAKPRTRDVS